MNGRYGSRSVELIRHGRERKRGEAGRGKDDEGTLERVHWRGRDVVDEHLADSWWWSGGEMRSEEPVDRGVPCRSHAYLSAMR